MFFHDGSNILITVDCFFLLLCCIQKALNSIDLREKFAHPRMLYLALRLVYLMILEHLNMRQSFRYTTVFPLGVCPFTKLGVL